MDIELVKKAQKAFEWYDKAVDNSIDYLNLEREEQQDAWNALEKLFEAIARQSVASEDVAEAIKVIQEKIYTHKEFIRQAKNTSMAINMLPHYDKIKHLDLAITALQAYQPWIPVSERLPMDSVPVLVTYIGFSDGKPYSDGVAKWSIELSGYNGGWAWTIDGSEVTVEITHWKPLPEPPKGE